MKTNVLILLFAACATLFLVSCGPDRSNNQTRTGAPEATLQKTAQDETPATTESADRATEKKDAARPSAAAEPTIATPDRKFMRTADLRFRTKDLTKTTQKIEEMTRNYGGFVAKSEQRSSVESTNTVSISNDSLLENTIYTLQTELLLRIPNKYFDTLLLKVQPMIDFLEHRSLTADDVSLSMLTNRLRTQRSRQLAQHLRQAVDKNGKKLGEVVTAENILAETQNEGDEAAVSNLSLQDKVDFCTVSLNIYQRKQVQQRMIADNSRYENFRAPFFSRLWEAIANGWFGFLEIIVGLSNIWTLLLLGVGGWFAWRKLRKQKIK